MPRVFNFSAGPAALPRSVLEQVREELLDWQGVGASVMEISHRGRPFMEMAERAESDLRELLQIPSKYKILFLAGGAQAQFSCLPLNLLGDRDTADYVITGHWSEVARKEGERYCRANVAASGSREGFTTIPNSAEWRCDPDAAYLHYTPNETIHGVAFNDVPRIEGATLVADMTSCLLSERVDVSRFGMIYAGAQKNIGPAGLTVVIVREDLLNRASPLTPKVYDYRRQAEAGSMANTPPTFAWYVSGLVFRWLKEQGGLDAMEATNLRKARKLYDTIDESGGFYRNPVDPPFRSRMNVPFTLADSSLDEAFLREAESSGFHALKGHRAVGGMRASIYNAMPEAGVDALVDFMKYFHSNKG
ncbi:MAG: 3-phosphoserine/phosphohydroxythreonine transaminase [Gammaproteobacteria bacterium]|nr:3-phosphoserine/phosphohydroxythreonine transaminase [Gammaproteobacteria bacterium]